MFESIVTIFMFDLLCLFEHETNIKNDIFIHMGVRIQ